MSKSTFTCTAIVSVLLLATGCAGKGSDSGSKSFLGWGKKNTASVQTEQAQKDAGMSFVDDKAPPLPSLEDVAAAREDLGTFVASHPFMKDYYKNDNRRRACWLNPLGEKNNDAQTSFYCEMPFEFRFCNSLALRKVNENPELDALGKVRRKMERYDQCRRGMGALYDNPFNGFNFDGFRAGEHKSSGKVSSVYYWVFLRNEDYLLHMALVSPGFDAASLVTLPAAGFDRTDTAAFADLARSTNDLYLQWIFSPLRKALAENPISKMLKLDGVFAERINELEDSAAAEIGKLGEKYVIPGIQK